MKVHLDTPTEEILDAVGRRINDTGLSWAKEVRCTASTEGGPIDSIVILEELEGRGGRVLRHNVGTKMIHRGVSALAEAGFYAFDPETAAAFADTLIQHALFGRVLHGSLLAESPRTAPDGDYSAGEES